MTDTLLVLGGLALLYWGLYGASDAAEPTPFCKSCGSEEHAECNLDVPTFLREGE